MGNLSVSVMTPTLNQGRFIEDTIRSVLNQSVPSLEYIVIDGGSTDETLAILLKYQDQLTWISEQDKGQAHALNKGLMKASGDIIGWINSDDVYTENAIKRVLHVFNNNPSIDIVYGYAYFFDENNQLLNRCYITEPWDLEKLKQRCYLSQPAVFFRRRLITTCGLLKENLHYCLDYEYWLRLGLNGVNFYYLQEELAGTRIYSGTKTSRFRLQAYFETIDMLQHLLGYIPSHWIVHFAIANAKSKTTLDHLHPWFIYTVWCSVWKAGSMHFKGSDRILFWLNAHTILFSKFYYRLKGYLNIKVKKNKRWMLDKIKKMIRPRVGNLNQYSVPLPMITPSRYHHRIHREPSLTISIVTPSFNQGNFLERTILSVLNQAYPNIEYIIQDGGSKDNSVDIIRNYASSLKYWESKQDNGQSHAINLGFTHASGEIMAYLNSDDILLPGALNYIANYFTRHPEIDVVYGHRVLINEDDQEIGRWVLPPHDAKTLTWVDYIPQETLFWRRRIWEKSDAQIDESFKFAMDWDLILRFQAAGARFARLPRFLGGFRVHSQQKTTANADVGAEEVSRLRARQHGRVVLREEVNKHWQPYLVHHMIYHTLYRLGILRY